jgi:GrpB-like predicted nucleotidyltransferase (UPF0157 family)
VGGTYIASDQPSNVGHTFLAIDPEAFGTGFRERLDALCRLLRESPPAAAAQPIRLPGDRRRQSRSAARLEGIEISEQLNHELNALAVELGRTPLMEMLGEADGEPVKLVDYDPAWPERFTELRERLAGALGPAALRIDHMGSTSVPGLGAKPVIDIQLSVADVEDEASYRPAIEGLVWPLRLREPERRFFRPPAGRPREVHVHVCTAGSRWEREHLLFRDYLRAHPERAAGYEAVKRGIAATVKDRYVYTDLKGPFIVETMDLAEEWAERMGWRL